VERVRVFVKVFIKINGDDENRVVDVPAVIIVIVRSVSRKEIARGKTVSNSRSNATRCENRTRYE